MPNNITGAESGGDPIAKNPRSSALGLGQFVNRTWLDMIRRYRPDLAQGKSPAEILELRTDPVLSQQMTDAYAAENEAQLRQKGLPVTPGSTYLMHFAGPSGAVALLKADPNTPVESILSNKAIESNPFLRGKTASWVIDWANKRIASVPAPKQSSGQPIPSLAQTQALEPAFGATNWLQRPTSPNELLSSAVPPFAPFAGAPSVAPVPSVVGTMRAQQALDNPTPALGAAPWALSDRFGAWNNNGGVSGPMRSGANGDHGQIDDGNDLASDPRFAQTGTNPPGPRATPPQSGDAAGVGATDPSSVRRLSSRILGIMPVDRDQPPRAADQTSGIAGDLPSFPPMWHSSEALLTALDRNRAPSDRGQPLPFRSAMPPPQDTPGGIPGLMARAGLFDPQNPDAPPAGGLMRLLQEWMRNNPGGGSAR